MTELCKIAMLKNGKIPEEWYELVGERLKREGR